MRTGDSFDSKVVVTTGGSSGIGKQIAEDFLRLGAQVVICGETTGALMQTQKEFEQAGLTVVTQACDVRSSEQVQHLADSVLAHYGHIDILINNAGYAVYRPFEESSPEEVLDLLDVNLAGAMRCTKSFLPGMISRRSGQIVNIASIGGETIITPNAVYCGAKHGMVAWSKAIRYELAHFGIKVNVVCPAYVKTNFHKHPTFKRREIYRGNSAIRKLGHTLTVADVSRMVLDAIRRDRAVSYVPRWQRMVVWALSALPFITLPIWDHMMRRRIFQLYEQIEKEKA